MKKYKIIVSEPFDFRGPMGDNSISGEVVKTLSPLFILFKADYFLNFDGQTGKLLVLKSRYEKQTLNKGLDFGGTVNVGLLLTDNYKEKDEKSLEENSKYILIGSLEGVF